jgi:hypothetical protein
MAHFAKIDNYSGTVQNVIVIGNKDCGGGDFPDSETPGQEFIRDVLGLEGTWLQTSYNGNFRRRYAGVGYKYDTERDAFLPPKPYPSWVLNENTLTWDPPIPHPDPQEGVLYEWDESTLSWREIIIPSTLPLSEVE